MMITNSVKVSDKLMKEISRNNSQAFERLYKDIAHVIYGYSLSIVKDQYDAEDVLQEVFITIYKKIDSYKYQGKAMAWIMTITRNASLMKLRKRTSNQDIDSQFDLSSSIDIEHEVENKEVVRRVVKVLNNEEKEILYLHLTYGLKHKDIADILDLPLSTVLSKYRRSLIKLRKELEVIGYEE
jgi:RNA polymerase sigma-70 factor (ECF subfamily)